MSIYPIVEDLKDAITDVVSDEYYHRAGGETRHWLEGIELVVGGIVTAFLIPYLKKLAEKAAEATWDAITASPKKVDRSTTCDTEFLSKAESIITIARSDDHRVALKSAVESVRIEMQKNNFSEEVQSLTIQNFVVEIERILHSKEV